eukprot:3106560-Rhodomonas_salina.1
MMMMTQMMMKLEGPRKCPQPEAPSHGRKKAFCKDLKSASTIAERQIASAKSAADLRGKNTNLKTGQRISKMLLQFSGLLSLRRPKYKKIPPHRFFTKKSRRKRAQPLPGFPPPPPQYVSV